MTAEPAEVLDALAGAGTLLSAVPVAKIERLIVRDHRFHEGRPLRVVV